jgi:hypothetical protein
LCALALVVAACGGDGGGESSGDTSASGTDTEQTTAPEAQSDATQPDADEPSNQGGAEGLPPGGTGSVTIDGEPVEVRWVGNCIIDERFNPHPDDLDLVVALDGGLNALFIEIGFEDLSDGLLMRFRPELQRQSADGYSNFEPEGEYMLAPDGTWYQDTEGSLYVALFSGQPHDNEVVDAPVVVDGNTISGSLLMMSSTGSVDVSFDLKIVEPVDCSL